MLQESTKTVGSILLIVVIVSTVALGIWVFSGERSAPLGEQRASAAEETERDEIAKWSENGRPRTPSVDVPEREEQKESTNPPEGIANIVPEVTGERGIPYTRISRMAVLESNYRLTIPFGAFCETVSFADGMSETDKRVAYDSFVWGLSMLTAESLRSGEAESAHEWRILCLLLDALYEKLPRLVTEGGVEIVVERPTRRRSGLWLRSRREVENARTIEIGAAGWIVRMMIQDAVLSGRALEFSQQLMSSPRARFPGEPVYVIFPTAMR